MKFSRLRLSGFKSFVEPSELLIEDGLTGIVGPNGCGKSNLLEALRWVMGESSYKNMRASGMDDVIFAGTGNRPARNIAEVTLSLDNADGDAPAQYNELETIEVSRRIEREAGSSYRINGKDMRARDVQLLFADASTGARSPALVKQGQIGELINAKPQARRRILEEAAGITGLYTRRHEAELKLNGAETNLTRLDDVVGQLELQLQNLKRQARQAIRYKQLSAEIRQLQAAVFYHTWRTALETLQSERSALDEVNRLLAGFTKAVSQATRNRDEVVETLNPLREQEAVRAAVAQRLMMERDGLERELEQAQARQRELTARLAQIEADLLREREMVRDTDEVFARLEAEEKSLKAATKDQGTAQAEAAKTLQAAADTLARSQQQADEAADRLSALTARRDDIKRRLRDHQGQLERANQELSQIKQKRAGLADDDDTDSARLTLDQQLQNTIAKAAQAEAAAETAEAELAAAREKETTARQEFDNAQRAFERLSTEKQTLSKLLNVTDGDLWPPVIDAVKVKGGYETALGAALGDDLDAPIDRAAPVHWADSEHGDADAPLPAGCKPLSEFVKAPAALKRRLRQIGIVDADKGTALQAELQPGQRLVSIAGDLWRWDGFTAAADAPTAAANRLAERNRLDDLEQQTATAGETAAENKRALETARQSLQKAVEAERRHRQSWRENTNSVEAARASLSRFDRDHSQRMQEVSALEEAARRVSQTISDCEGQLNSLQTDLAALPNSDGLQAELDKARATTQTHRSEYGDARARHDTLAREIKLRADRLAAIAQEREQWQARSARAGEQIAIVENRLKDTRKELTGFDDMPDQFDQRRKKIMSALADAEKQKAEAGDNLAEAETRAREAEQAVKESEGQLAGAREETARLQARLEAAEERLESISAQTSQQLECQPEKILETFDLNTDGLISAPEAETRLAKLREQRERLGGVNLRAEVEAEETGKQLDEIITERDDLIAAINKLRHGIGVINKEGRERLLEAFVAVNSGFSELFTTLFNGGKAELQLVESDDPLEAGLEILAHPPGKKPQVLSLLSGGEQALTALALIFAVFLTNPSPICVLDEVDAPLDDHNVERFCNLLDSMLERSQTRFLIITHHALTLARMHRLFGVTMMEKGISQLVSVDLQMAETLREAG